MDRWICYDNTRRNFAIMGYRGVAKYMKYAYRLGKAMMLPVACLPVAGLLLGIGYWMDPTGYGANSLPAQLLIQAGSVLIGNMSLLFATGMAMGLADEQDGTAVVAGVAAWIVIQNILTPANVQIMTGGRTDPSSFQYINNQMAGIYCGVLGAYCSNQHRKKQLSSGRRLSSGFWMGILKASGCAAVSSLVLLIIWPRLYEGSVYIGRSLLGTGAVGAGTYMFLNRLMIPTGLHHALNSVFWFDLAGISDLKNFWEGSGVYGQTGQYMTGFFPVMIFGLPGAALAMYQTARKEKKKMTGGLLMTAALCSLLTGITEPMEFSFMFLAPELFFLHAFLTGFSGFVCSVLPFRIGFNFSAGLVDYFMALNAPMAENPWMLWPVGAVFGALYYAVFRFFILRFRLKTPGREDEQE